MLRRLLIHYTHYTHYTVHTTGGSSRGSEVGGRVIRYVWCVWGGMYVWCDGWGGEYVWYKVRYMHCTTLHRITLQYTIHYTLRYDEICYDEQSYFDDQQLHLRKPEMQLII